MAKNMARLERFELPTLGTGIRCSIRAELQARGEHTAGPFGRSSILPIPEEHGEGYQPAQELWSILVFEDIRPRPALSCHLEPRL